MKSNQSPAASVVLLMGFACAAVTLVGQQPGEPAVTPPVESKTTKLDELALAQGKVADKYARLEQLLIRMAELEASENPQRAALLKRAAQQSSDRLTRQQLNTLIKLLTPPAQLKRAIDDQEQIVNDLRALLELLQSENRSDRLKSEQNRIRDYLKEVDLLIRLQKSVQGRNAGGDDAQKLAGDQQQVANRTGELAQRIIENEEGGKKQSSDTKSSDDAKDSGEKSPDGSKDSEAEQGTDKKQDGDKSEGDSKSDSKSGSNSDSKGKSSDSVKGKDGGKKDADSGKNGDSDKKPSPGEKSPDEKSPGEKSTGEKPEGDKDSTDKEPEEKSGDSKSADRSSGDKGKANKSQKSKSSKSAKGSKGKDGQPGEESQENESSESESQESESPEEESANPARKRLQAAEERMREAQRKLAEANRKDATEEQEKAREELERAKAELEQILRQLREEEVERTLALLEGRFRNMLEGQLKIYESTKRLDKIPAAQRTRDLDIQASKLSFDESKLAVDADKALLVLREEGSSVAFPETVEMLRDDMQTVADRLQNAKVDQVTQGIEEEIIQSLEELIAALQKAQQDLKDKKPPPQRPGQPMEPGNNRPLVDQLAELRMIRSLQLRVNTRTQRYARLLENTEDPVGRANDADLRQSLIKLAEMEKRVFEITRNIVLGKNQ